MSLIYLFVVRAGLPRLSGRKVRFVGASEPQFRGCQTWLYSHMWEVHFTVRPKSLRHLTKATFSGMEVLLRPTPAKHQHHSKPPHSKPAAPSPHASLFSRYVSPLIITHNSLMYSHRHKMLIQLTKPNTSRQRLLEYPFCIVYPT